LIKIYYEAVDAHGVKIKGSFQGSEEEFSDFIEKSGLFLISYEKKELKLSKSKFSTKDYIYFVEEMYYLISSGMPLDRALKNLIKNSVKESQKEFYEKILQYLKEGNQFSLSLHKAANDLHMQLDELSILLIETNESVGNLALGLKKAHEHLSFKESIMSEIKQAMAYPIFLIVMSILLVFFVFIFIVPKFAEIFTPKEFEKLPLLSKYILQTGLYVNENLYKIFIIFGISLVLGFLYRKQLKNIIFDLMLYFKKFKDLVINLQLSYFFGAFSLMLSGGIDIKKALKLSSKIITYPELKSLILKTHEELKRGQKLSDSFSGSDLIDVNTVSLIAAGENSATLPEVFDSLSKRYLKEFQNKTKSLLSLLEPAVIIIMGGVIAVIVVSIMLAVMSISDITG